MSVAGLGIGLAGLKLFAVGLGMALHLRRIHSLIALLTAIYVACATLYGPGAGPLLTKSAEDLIRTLAINHSK